MTTYAHVTVTVVMDGVTAVYDIPKVENFQTGVEYEPVAKHDTLSYGPLESSAPPRLKALTFSMRPFPDGASSIYTLTRSA